MMIVDHYVLRHMTLEDVNAVVAVDRLSFSTPWPERSYVFELTDSRSSHMLTLEAVSPTVIGQVRQIVGYGGMWLIEGEAHISTLAVHPEWRGQKLGEVLLTGMLSRALALNASYSVLEVRVSNVAALSLYYKYEYAVVGRRHGYYRDNNEDAFLMHLAPLDAAYNARFQDRVSMLHRQVHYLARLSDSK